MKKTITFLAFVMLVSLSTVCFGQQKTKTKTFTVNNVSFTMVYVEGGEAVIGRTSEQDQRYQRCDCTPSRDAFLGNDPAQVTLNSYWIGQTEVTQELWEAVMGENPSKNKDNPKQPVTNVSWDDCRVFITRLNALTGEVFRMPTEAEWEYAARGGSYSQWYKFSGSNNREEVACDGTCPVATKKANELGIYDMSGTVQNWCKNGVGFVGLLEGGNNPQGCSRCEYRISRGGYDVLGIAHARCSYKPDIRIYAIGLRLARSVKQKVVEED
jgi:formylglycine-generating enzyme required for sulfatase activity